MSTTTEKATSADVDFYFRPGLPVRLDDQQMAAHGHRPAELHGGLEVHLPTLINAEVDYDTHYPPGYEDGHTAGLRLLRVAARTRAEHGADAVGLLYQAIGTRIFDTPEDQNGAVERGSARFVEPILAEVGLPAGLADALDDSALDAMLRAETDEALALTGKDVGAPIIHFQPPTGGGVSSVRSSARLPNYDDAARLWDHVVGLASFPGFAELNRSLRERPQLASFGVDPDRVGVQEDWHGGSRRTKK